MLSKKLVTLLALVTAHRFQTLSLIKIQNIIFSAEGTVNIFITDNIKTSGPGRAQPCLHFKKFQEKPEICVLNTLMDYIDRTISVRQEEQEYLFISFVRPYKRASSQTLSRLVKETMSEAGINTNIFSSYSTRHSSTSMVYKAGVSLDIIRKTAGWSDKSRTFARFYNRPIVTNSFAETILKSRC